MCNVDTPDVAPRSEDTNTEQEQLRIAEGDERRKKSQKSGTKALTVALNSGGKSSSTGSGLKA